MNRLLYVISMACFFTCGACAAVGRQELNTQHAQRAVPVITILTPPEPNGLETIHLTAQLAGFLTFQGNCTRVTTKGGMSFMPIFPSGTEVQQKGGQYYIVNRDAKLRLRYNSNVALGGGFGAKASNLSFAVHQEGCGDFFVVSPME